MIQSSGFYSVLALILISPLLHAETVVYENNFSEGTLGDEWSQRRVELTPLGAKRFLGRFENHDVELALTDQPPHDMVTVSLRLYIISTWDGCPDGQEGWAISVESIVPQII